MFYAFLFAVITGFSAYAYSHSIGENLHIDQTVGQWQNYEFIEELLDDMHIYSVRSSLQVANRDGGVQFLNELAGRGIASDEFVNTSYTTTPQVASALQPLRGVLWLEGPNEQDVCCDDASWVAHDQQVAAILAPFKATYSVIAPSVSLQDPAMLGNLTNAVTYGNAHYYTSTRMPETPGWGGIVYGQPYGGIAYALAQARRVGATLPVVSTEEGYSSALVSEETQASYVERATLWLFNNGIAHQWLYDLVDDSQAFGVARTDGSLKPVAYGLGGLLELTDDTMSAPGPCSLNASIGTTLPYDEVLLCKSDGEKDLILWEPAQLQNPTTGVGMTATEGAVVVTAPQTTGTTIVYEQSPEYRWCANVMAVNSQAIGTLSERPLIIAFHAPRTATFPPLPTLVPIPGMTPTPPNAVISSPNS